ncbi:MAG: division/cell wall cluster transcriptional repressor MraZ [Pirellulales bacterium]|nr:division/cell wall cluster transcriptional repressor MraZ [Pirellulales bacterium]
MLLTGTYSRVVDDKLRVSLPKRLREAMNCEEDGVVFVTPGTDGSLAIYTAVAFDRLASQLSQASPTRRDVRAFRRMLYGQAQQVELDRQGRLRIGPELARSAGIQKEVVLVGVEDHLELWDQEAWDAYLAEQQPRYDAIAETAFAESSAGFGHIEPESETALSSRPR